MNKRLLRKYGYHIGADFGDLSVTELLHIMQTEDGMPNATYEDAEYALNIGSDCRDAYQRKMREKADGWEALKHDGTKRTDTRRA
jgi:hypothetical protein